MISLAFSLGRIKDQIPWPLFASAGFYIAVLLVENYSRYFQVGQFGIALQGRYIFPVLAPLVGVITVALLGHRNKLLNVILFLFLALVWLGLSSQTFWSHVDRKNWLTL